MGKGRLEAFSDGVIAIIITIMVLELKAPHGRGFDALLPLIPFVTAWMDENFAAAPVAIYGVVLLMSAVAYYILARTLIRENGRSRNSHRRSARTPKASHPSWSMPSPSRHRCGSHGRRSACMCWSRSCG
jgi:uncharacterized membrane protein